MIQRIQSVYLLVGSLLLASNYLLSRIWTGPAAGSSDWFTPVTLGLYSLAIVGALFAIALFNNRDRQLQVILVAIVTAMVGFTVLCICLYTGGVLPGMESVEMDTLQPFIAVLTPLAAVVMFGLARRGIKADIKLLKSVDRLR